MRKLFFMLLAVCTLIGCKDDDGGGDPNITVPNENQLSQTVYADQISGTSGVSFTTTGAWTSTITETAQASASIGRATKAGAPDWISINPASGDKAGNYTLGITLGENFTGEKRTATIAITCNGQTITITITQDGKTEAGKVPEKHVTGITISKETLTLEKGEKDSLSVVILPSTATNKTVTWSSSSETVVTVSQNGLVTAVGPGTATILVITQDGAKTAQCVVTVPNYPLTGITLNKTQLTLEKFNTETLLISFMPTNATNQNITWSSSNPDVATVDNGKVTPVKAGTTTISVVAEDGEKTAQCEVTVIANTPNGSGSITLNDVYGDYNTFSPNYANQKIADSINYKIITLYLEGEMAFKDGQKIQGSLNVPFKVAAETNTLAAGTYAFGTEVNTFQVFDAFGLGMKMYYTSGTITVAKSGDTYTITLDVSGQYNPGENGTLKGTYTGKIITI